MEKEGNSKWQLSSGIYYILNLHGNFDTTAGTENLAAQNC